MLRFVLSASLLLGLIYVGSHSWQVGNNKLPALMDFLSPHTGIWQMQSTEIDELQRWPGLIDRVDIVLDERHIPHIFGQDYIDVAYALGFMHARDRLFQMDVTSRFTLGRLSELLGTSLTAVDRLSRRRGLPMACQRQYEQWQSLGRTSDIMQAYADGVNEYLSSLDHRNLPVEYRLLGQRPGRWSALQSAAIIKSMAFDLCFRNEDDAHTATRASVGEEAYRLLFPHRYPSDRPIIPSGTSWDYIVDPPTEPLDDDLGLDLPDGTGQLDLPPKANGSNNWAISGDKTASGHPILCNDPHLALRLPSIWYEAQLHTPEVNVYGVTIPGLPAVAIGYNDKIAWGMTNWGGDVLDWFKVDWVDRSQLTYRLDDQITQGEWLTYETTVDGITTTDSVAWTYWGPVTYYDDMDHRLADYAMKWVGHLTHDVDEVATFFDLANASNQKEIVTALKQFRSPTQNIAFATQEGDIGLRISGAWPIRPTGTGAFIYPGDQTSYDWQGFVPQDHQPMVLNPTRGYVSSANQVSTDSTYPYPYHGYFSDWRGRLLNGMLDTMTSVTIDDVKRLQLDDQSLLASEGLEVLVRHLDLSQCSVRERELFERLERWDGRFNAKAEEPIYFHTWFTDFYHSTWDEIEREHGLRIPDHRQTIALALDTPTLIFFDDESTDHHETAGDIVQRCWTTTVRKVDSIIEAKPDYGWADHNSNRVRHLLQLDPFSSEINEVSGYKYALNAVNSTHGPSWRMVVELSDPVRAWGIYPGGPSGHPGDAYYDPDVALWASGKYHRLYLYPDLATAQETASHHINCKP